MWIIIVIGCACALIAGIITIVVIVFIMRKRHNEKGDEIHKNLI